MDKITNVKSGIMTGPGYIVVTKSGKTGRTFHHVGLIHGKIPVYLCTKFIEHKNPPIKVAVEFSNKAILCTPKSLTAIGFID